jgi:hypothetical protein
LGNQLAHKFGAYVIAIALLHERDGSLARPESGKAGVPPELADDLIGTFLDDL